MGNFAQIVTSFERTGDFPIEANYIFATVDELKSFYEDEVQKATLHKGLLKIVEDDGDGKQGLFWIEPDESGELVFTELVAANTAKELISIGDSLYELVQSVVSLEDAVNALGTATLSGEDSLKAQIRAIVGCEDCDVLETLSTLKYGSLTAISEYLESEDMDAFWNKIEGDPLPSEDYQTFRGVENAIGKLASENAYAHQNIIKEVDKIETGVGLNADGSYSPDPTTNYLTDATSVMHALRILDNLIHNTETGGIIDGYYDSETESLVLVLAALDSEGNNEKIVIPVASLITEWITDGSDTATIVLKRDRVIDGPDVLSASLKISESENNYLTVDEDGALFVDPFEWAEYD